MKKKVLLLGVLAILSTVAFGEIVDTNEIGVWNELDSNAFFEIEENQETQKIIEVGEETMGTDFSLEGEVTTELEVEQPQKIIEVGEETIGTLVLRQVFGQFFLRFYAACRYSLGDIQLSFFWILLLLYQFSIYSIISIIASSKFSYTLWWISSFFKTE